MRFSFYQYEFSDDLLELKKMLNLHKISYKEKKYYIKFKIKSDQCVEDIRILAFYNGNIVLKLVLEMIPISYNRKKNIEGFFDTNYNIISKDISKLTNVYTTEDYAIVFNASNNITVEVNFIPEGTKGVFYHETSILKATLLSILGACLSALFIFLYFWFNNIYALSIITGIIAIAYGLYELNCIFLSRNNISKKSKIAIMIVAPSIYFLIFFIIMLLGIVYVDVDLIGQTMNNIVNVFAVVTYLAPSFHIVLALALLIMSGM